MPSMARSSLLLVGFYSLTVVAISPSALQPGTDTIGLEQQQQQSQQQSMDAYKADLDKRMRKVEADFLEKTSKAPKSSDSEQQQQQQQKAAPAPPPQKKETPPAAAAAPPQPKIPTHIRERLQQRMRQIRDDFSTKTGRVPPPAINSSAFLGEGNLSGGNHSGGSTSPVFDTQLLLKAQRAALQKWEETFESEHGRKPTGKDKKNVPEYMRMLDEYIRAEAAADAAAHGSNSSNSDSNSDSNSTDNGSGGEKEEQEAEDNAEDSKSEMLSAAEPDTSKLSKAPKDESKLNALRNKAKNKVQGDKTKSKSRSTPVTQQSKASLDTLAHAMKDFTMQGVTPNEGKTSHLAAAKAVPVDVQGWESKVGAIPQYACLEANNSPDVGEGETPQPPATTYETCYGHEDVYKSFMATVDTPELHDRIRGAYQSYMLLDTLAMPARYTPQHIANEIADNAKQKLMAGKGAFKSDVNERNFRSLNTKTKTGYCRGIYSQDAFTYVYKEAKAGLQSNSELSAITGMNMTALGEVPPYDTDVLGHGGAMIGVFEYYVPEATAIPFRINPGPYAFTDANQVSLTSVAIKKSLQWAIDNHEMFNLTVISIATYVNNKFNQPLASFTSELEQLDDMGILVVFTAGPNYGEETPADCNCWPGNVFTKKTGQALCPAPGVRRPGAELCNYNLTTFVHECALITSIANAMHSAEYIAMVGAIKETGFKWKTCGSTIKEAVTHIFDRTSSDVVVPLMGAGKTAKATHINQALTFVTSYGSC